MVDSAAGCEFRDDLAALRPPTCGAPCGVRATRFGPDFPDHGPRGGSAKDSRVVRFGPGGIGRPRGCQRSRRPRAMRRSGPPVRFSRSDVASARSRASAPGATRKAPPAPFLRIAAMRRQRAGARLQRRRRGRSRPRTRPIAARPTGRRPPARRREGGQRHRPSGPVRRPGDAGALLRDAVPYRGPAGTPGRSRYRKIGARRNPPLRRTGRDTCPKRTAVDSRAPPAPDCAPRRGRGREEGAVRHQDDYRLARAFV